MNIKLYNYTDIIIDILLNTELFKTNSCRISEIKHFKHDVKYYFVFMIIYNI